MQKKAGVIITAAGLSQRMGVFKPLLPLGDKTMIEHVVDNAAAGGISDIIVIIGKDKDNVKRQLTGRPVKMVENPDFSDSDMLQSIKYGIRALNNDSDCFFIIPGDMPLVSGACYQCMLTKFKHNPDKKIVQVRYQNDGGHPILIGRECRQRILDYEDEGGLKEALRVYADDISVLEWHNSTILLDADTPLDYKRMCRVYESREVPGKMVIFTLLNMKQTSIDVVHHSLAVEKVALFLADKAVKKGYDVNSNLVSAGAMLHDIAKGNSDHAQKGAAFLREIGYEKVAVIVEEHMFLSEEAKQCIDERAIVYLADKLVAGTKSVSLDERFKNKLQLYKDNPEVYNRVVQNKKTAERIKKLLD